ncbi:MAG: methylmalonyl-CoA epimerase [Proteobacteria bacterium]|nr:methylmalonyl-CoA epimerase [Pseudomonadota bacterium]
MIKEIDHIGIIVPNLETGISQWSKQLGLKCEGVIEKKDIGLKVAFFRIGGLIIELLEFERPIGGVDEIVFKGFGIQHIAFRVDDIRGSIKEFTKRGLTLLRGFPREGAHGQVAFFSFGDERDYLVEICEGSPKS